MAYQYTPHTHNSPTLTENTLSNLKARLQHKYSNDRISYTLDEYGEGSVFVNGTSVGTIEQWSTKR